MLRTVLPGVALGLAGALAGSRGVASQLYGITPADLVSYLVAAGLAVLVALAATAVPVRRALRLNPLDSLRQE
jgi:ABC-type antimicrobial peptide transport system permease subunit